VKELVAYFDDSRNEDAGIVVVAGYVASVATWDRFGSAWARALGAGPTRHTRETPSVATRCSAKSPSLSATYA
jgi:hypothetical protein